MRFFLLLCILGCFQFFPADGQQLNGLWRGALTQEGQTQSFDYELQLEQNGKALSGAACSQSSDGYARACFELSGVIGEKEIVLQEIRQTEPEEPRWCLKYISLKLSNAENNTLTLSGNWKASGCRPGTLNLKKVDNGPANRTEELPFAFEGRWTGHLSQSDRDYGFYYEVVFDENNLGRSSIDSESNGGRATHALSWQTTDDRQLHLQESAVVEKTDPQWPWCIKSARLQYRRDGGKHILEGTWQGYIEGYTQETGACAPGTVYLEKPVITREVTDFVQSQDADYKLKTNRTVKVDRVLEVQSENLKIKVWDNGIVDGDYVTIFLNGERLLHNYRVSKRKWTIPVKLKEDNNFLILHAEDLGDIPPNTVAVSVDDGFKEEILILSSNLETSGGVLIKQFKVD